MRIASRLAITMSLALGATALSVTSASAATFSNTAPITIPNTISNATPYPSQITVSGQTAPISDLNVNLNGFTHGAPSDLIGPLLVAPGGQALLLMACVGSDGTPAGATNVNVKLDDSSGILLPAFPGIVPSGTFKPTNRCGPLPSFPSPGPLTSYGNPGPGGGGGTATLASTFNGANANGVWSLFVRDEFLGESGQFAGGWSLEISPDPAVAKKKCKKGKKLKKGKCVKKKRKKKKKK